MFDLTKFLKTYNSRSHWNSKIKRYIKEAQKLNEFNKGKSYFCGVETAIGFIKSLEKLDSIMKLEILNDLYERRVLELKSELVNIPVQTVVKGSKSLESEHFNIYGVSNIAELAQNIIKDIEKVDPDQIGSVFKDYVYFFTYFYKYTSIRTHIASIRKAIRDSDLSEEKKEIAVKEFKFSDRIHDYLNEGGAQKRVQNMTEVLIPIETLFLEKFMNKSKRYLIEKVTKQNKKIAFSHLTALVALSIGRRLTEIVNQSEVTKVSDYKVQIVGLAKKRHDEIVTIIVPTLFLNADEVIEAIAKLKDLIPKGLKTRAERDKYAHNLADFKMIDRKLWVQNSKFASLRAVYAVVSELIYNQNNIIEENRKPQATYIQQILGHGSEDFTTYQHYYKRQVLLKSFDLASYLEQSKTAMI
jgi:hypothetical protein